MPVLREERIELVIDRIYEAATEPTLWREVLNEAAEALGAAGAVLFSFPQTPTLGAHWSPGIDDLVDWIFRDGAHLHNPRPERAMRFCSPKQAVTESDLFTRWELEHLPFNAEMAGRLGYRWDAGGIVGAVDGVPLFFTAQRRQHDEGFQRAELGAIEALFPHIERAAQISSRLSLAHGDGMLAAFDDMACGGVLLDFLGRVSRMNRNAERMLEPELGVIASRLVAHRSDTNAALQKLIGMASQGTVVPARAPEPAGLPIPRPGKSPLLIYAMPVRGSASDILRPARAILVLIDTHARRGVPEFILAQSFGLTPAEARIALALSEGKDLKAIAHDNSVSVGTARTQLKVLMAKTGTHRQAELVALLGRMALGPGPNGSFVKV